MKLVVVGTLALALLEVNSGEDGNSLIDSASRAASGIRAEAAREAGLFVAVKDSRRTSNQGGRTPVLPVRSADRTAPRAIPVARSSLGDTGTVALAPVGPYAFTYPGAMPGGWNPCAPIPILVNLANAPAGALEDVQAALAQIDAASGLKFTVDGTTTTPPRADWGLDSRGSWKPVLVAWDRPGANLITGSEAGSTSAVAIDDGSSKQIVSGIVEFNSTLNGYYRPGFGPGMYRGTLMLHEFGHLAGLDHVTDPHQVMYPVTQTASGLGSGDRAGLRHLGQRVCKPAPTPAP